jgi:drug/metabolite transporter (DMT)-like permease
MLIHELAALLAALCWSVTGLIAVAPVRHLGAFTFTRYRMIVVLVMFAILITVTGRWASLQSWQIAPVVMSGLFGILLGDCILFVTQYRLGPRRTSILFATNAPISVVLGWLILGERLTALAMMGFVLTFTGVMLAIAFNRSKGQQHAWEEVRGPLWVGVAFGLLAALMQSTGALFARPVMSAGADPFVVSFIRVAVSVAGLQALSLLPYQFFKPQNPLTVKTSMALAATGIVGMGVGMTLVLFALSGGKVGIVSILSATSPALQLPLIWFVTKERPPATAWLGSVLAVIGSALIFLR